MLKGHGDDIYDYGGAIISNFSSNTCYDADLRPLMVHLSDKIGSVASYPEPDARSLKERLAVVNGIEPDNLWITNGATEAIYLIAQAFAGCNTAIVIPTFSEYEDACRVYGHRLSFYRSPEEIPSDVEMIWMCNPNNPDGRVYEPGFLRDFVASRKHTLMVIDQSYEYFTQVEPLTDREAVGLANVILVHSMTKRYAIPGLRLGYLAACDEIMEKIVRLCMPWSVNGLAVEAGKYLLDRPDPQTDRDRYLEESLSFQQSLSRTEGVRVISSRTHFFLCRLNGGKASELKEYLALRYGFLIRDASNFRGLDEQYFRVCSRSRTENEALVKAIGEWMCS
ncbi:MAG: pyridoxal phosphate-dependent class II aminotransferase [Rikenellaceae bacterium]|nr:pyridoxal phosphate-dependent class II aminotransferase [Rikenellaceae bacterium]